MKTVNENLKRVLFGKQKQANAINDAVVNIVETGLVKLGYMCLEEEHCAQVLEDALGKIVGGKVTMDESLKVFVSLVAGDYAIEMLESCEPVTVSVIQPSSESPKRIFRIVSAMNAIAEYDETTYKEIEETKPATVVSTKIENETFADQAIRMRDRILPTVPAAVKTEIPDNEWAQALCCAEAYIKNCM